MSNTQRFAVVFCIVTIGVGLVQLYMGNNNPILLDIGIGTIIGYSIRALLKG